MANPFPKHIKERLLQAWERAGRKPSQQELAVHFKTSNSAIGQWFNPDQAGIHISRFVDLARLLNVNLVWLLSGQGDIERTEEMSPSEQELLRKYRRLNDIDQRRTLNRIDELLRDYEPAPGFGTGA
jgi:transcriptional regulator with XRE-family HTH domain